MSLSDSNVLIQWLATAGKEQTRFFIRRQDDDYTDNVSIWHGIGMEYLMTLYSSTDHYYWSYYTTMIQ